MDFEKDLIYYQTSSGTIPFRDWLGKLRDERGRQRIEARLGYVRRGNFGVTNSVGGGVQELKINFGPGYRVYFARMGDQILVLLCGGDKSTQTKDILKAKSYWADFKDRYQKNKMPGEALTITQTVRAPLITSFPSPQSSERYLRKPLAIGSPGISRTVTSSP